MTARRCDKLADMDIGAYLASPDGARWQELRVHLASCDECRAQVATWTSLRQSLLREDQEHPAEELLLSYVDARASLDADLVASLEQHLADCGTCSDEIGVLRAVTISPIAVPTATREGGDPSMWQRFVAALRSPGWRPALALTTVLILMVPTLVLYGRRDLSNERAQMAVDDARSRGGSGRDVAPVTERADASQEVAPSARTQSAPIAGAPPAPPPPIAAETRNESAAAAASPQVAQLDRGAADTQLRARSSQLSDERAGQARGLTRQPAAVRLEYVSGGRGSVNLDEGGSVLMQVLLSSEPGSVAMKRDEARAALRHPNGVVAAPPVTRALELRVTAADGRVNRRAIRVGSQADGRTAQHPMSVEIPADWLAVGDNRIDIVAAGTETPVVRSYTLTRERP